MPPRHREMQPTAVIALRSALRPIEVRAPDDLGDVDLVVLIPLRAAEVLCGPVLEISRPGIKRLFVLPPDQCEAFTVGGGERLCVHEPAERARMLVHRRG